MKAAVLVATLVAAGLLAPAPPTLAADAAANVPNAPPAPVKKKLKLKAKQPMDLAAPMTIPMAKEGMMKGDVKAGAAKKDAAMAEMMKQEEAKMPPAAAQ